VPQQNVTQSADQLRAALEIVELAIANRDDGLSLVESHIPLEKLTVLVKNADPDVKKNVLILISTLLVKADSTKRKKLIGELYTKSNRYPIVQYVIQHTDVKDLMAHELHVLQRNCLNILEEKWKTPIDINDQSNKGWLHDLRKMLIEMGVDLSNQKLSEDSFVYKRLGFDVSRSMLYSYQY